MGFTFSETMAGTIEWDDAPGIQHPFKFEVTAQADSTRQHFKDGKATLRGTITAPPRANAVDTEGVITIRPLDQKIIRYELSFTGDDGKQYELVGQKDILWKHPVRTMSYLPCEILDEDHRRVATCKTTFDTKNDLWSFIRSFRSIR
jgi:hypothetical protein